MAGVLYVHCTNQNFQKLIWSHLALGKSYIWIQLTQYVRNTVEKTCPSYNLLIKHSSCTFIYNFLNSIVFYIKMLLLYMHVLVCFVTTCTLTSEWVFIYCILAFWFLVPLIEGSLDSWIRICWVQIWKKAFFLLKWVIRPNVRLVSEIELHWFICKYRILLTILRAQRKHDTIYIYCWVFNWLFHRL